jgi:hypothetical protein
MRLFFVFFICFTVSSCSKSENTDSAVVSSCKWTLNIDSKLYQWEGEYSTTTATSNNSGLAVYSTSVGGANPIAVVSLSSPLNIGINFQTIQATLNSVSKGSFQMNESSINPNTTIGNTLTVTLDNQIYSTIVPGSNVKFNIKELSLNSILNNGIVGAGFVKGDFSGTIGGLNGGGMDMHSINGTFSCIRLN